MQTEIENIATRYLLGELTEAESSDFEAKYFAEPSLFQAVTFVESQLIDDYNRGRLASETHKRFERYYMADPARRERVRFGRAFAHVVDSENQTHESPSRRRTLFDSLRAPWAVPRLAAAMVLLAAVAGGIYFLISSRNTRPDEVARVVTPSPAPDVPSDPPATRPVNTDVARPSLPPATVDAVTPDSTRAANRETAPRPTPAPATEPPRSVSLALAMGAVRGGSAGGAPVLTVPRGTATARLSVHLAENSYPSYELSLQTISGRELASRKVDAARVKSISELVITVPAGKLADGEHVLTVTGITTEGGRDDLSKSLFRVRKTN